MNRLQNLTATIADDIINVRWQKPFDCPPDIFFLLRVSHYPHATHADIAIPRNITSHKVNVTSHAGQNFTFKVKAVNGDSSGEFSDPVTVQTSKYLWVENICIIFMSGNVLQPYALSGTNLF